MRRHSGGVRLEGKMLLVEVDPVKAMRAMKRLGSGQGVSGSRRLAKLIRHLIHHHASFKSPGRPPAFRRLV